MRIRSHFASSSAVAMAAVLGLAAGPAFGQAAQSESEIEEVVVTGTLIAGAMKTGALPVQVITEDELEKRGDPSTL